MQLVGAVSLGKEGLTGPKAQTCDNDSSKKDNHGRSFHLYQKYTVVKRKHILKNQYRITLFYKITTPELCCITDLFPNKECNYGILSKEDSVSYTV